MSRVASLLLFMVCAGAAACASSRHSDFVDDAPSQPARRPPGIQTWVPIPLTEVAGDGLRAALTDLLMFVDLDVLWPGFALHDDPTIVVDSRNPQQTWAYCVGHCVPRISTTGGTSRLWRATMAEPLPPGEARFGRLSEWGLRGDGEIAAVSFQRREQAVTVLLHEHFHIHYQPDYVRSFGDDIVGDSRPASTLTRIDLETSYSATEPVQSDLRTECASLADALRAGRNDRTSAMAGLRRFSAAREARRARPGAPSFEEDFWEREEGVPVNLERRVAMRRNFGDPSLIGAAVSVSGCGLIPRASYLLMLGGLQAAVLDELGDAGVWPNRVYPRDGTPAQSLYALIRELLTQSERGDS